MPAMSHHEQSSSHLWHLSPKMNMPLCRLVAEETFRYRARLPIAAPNVHTTISDANKIHAETEKYLIFLNARNGLFNLEGLSQQWLEKNGTAFDAAVVQWFRHEPDTGRLYSAVMEELLEEVKRLYNTSNGFFGDSVKTILAWVALLVRVHFLRIPRFGPQRQLNDPFRTPAARQDAHRDSPTDGKYQSSTFPQLMSINVS